MCLWINVHFPVAILWNILVFVEWACVLCRQEGWRLEHEDILTKGSPLLFKGVVFNEMKGALVCVHNYRNVTLHGIIAVNSAVSRPVESRCLSCICKENCTPVTHIRMFLVAIHSVLWTWLWVKCYSVAHTYRTYISILYKEMCSSSNISFCSGSSWRSFMLSTTIQAMQGESERTYCFWRNCLSHIMLRGKWFLSEHIARQ